MALAELVHTPVADYPLCSSPVLCPDPRIFFPYPTGYRPPLPKRRPSPALSKLLADEHTLALAALELCANCAFRSPCLDEALLLDEQEGVWGGTTPTERRLMLRR